MRKTLQLWPALLLCVGLSSIGTAKATDIEPYPGTDWSVDVPEGFVLQNGTMPFFRNADGTSIVLMQVADLAVEKTAAPIGSTTGTPPDQIIVAASQALTLGEASGNLVEGPKVSEDVYVIEVSLATPQSKVLAIGLIPQANPSAATKDALRKALLSVTQLPSAGGDPTAHFPFVLGDSAGFDVASAVSGAQLFLTEGPATKDTMGSDDRFAMVYFGALSPEQAATFDLAEQLKIFVAGLQAKNPTAKIQSTKIEDSADGPVLQVLYRSQAEDGTLVNSMTLMRKAGQGMLLLFGQYPDADTTAPATFDRIFRSLRPR